MLTVAHRPCGPCDGHVLCCELLKTCMETPCFCYPVRYSRLFTVAHLVHGAPVSGVAMHQTGQPIVTMHHLLCQIFDSCIICEDA